MIFDTHMHTEYSSDSNMKISDVIDKSTKLNLGITLTEHLDLDFEDPTAFRVDIPKYLENYMPLRKSNLLFGVEFGMTEYTLTENKAIFEKHKNDLDFILGSIHAFNHNDIYSYLVKNNTVIPKETYYNQYLEAMLSCIKQYDFINSLAHIDYISRYAPYENPEVTYNEFSDRLDAVFKALIDSDKVIEINSARLNETSAINNMLKLYTRYKELGGKYVTIGSDAHNKTQIGRNIDGVKFILEKTNLIPVHFEKRKMLIDKF
ncbi:histidinol-phosphatase (PHP family) [Clostridium cavendishii DSM 21758]|uniref:Histidinol-phosphatase n=1 Tax=Clostridium cavendishii DSM 21758 TaxID=1121302 RepID=A0A1M6EB23_9CLOT|nr:histidinol-phosphatase HisJ family protein [Clostridium cavendishii]SHI82686.1 histidinol-phosphatase (PHP family) [Clostridium cavendishii DSM 21758]